MAKKKAPAVPAVASFLNNDVVGMWKAEAAGTAFTVRTPLSVAEIYEICLSTTVEIVKGDGSLFWSGPVREVQIPEWLWK